MIKDYHLHPMIMMTPPENFDAFVKAECASGVGEICITDHMPFARFEGKIDRIPMGRVTEYCDRVQMLREKYSGTISIKCGIEIDFHPTFCPIIEQILKEGEGRFDFILGSTHLGATIPSAYTDYPTPNAFAEASLRNTLAAAKSGYFTAISHLDQFRNRFIGDIFPPEAAPYCYQRHMDIICDILDAVEKENLYLEINPHLVCQTQKTEDTYPEPAIVKFALEKNLRFSYGSDAHSPQEAAFRLSELRNHPIYGKAIAKWEGEA